MARRRQHRQRIRDKAHTGVLATFDRAFYCHGCQRDHHHHLRVFGASDGYDQTTPAQVARRWRQATKRNERERVKLARRLGVAAEPADPPPPLSIEDWRRIAKRHRRGA